MDIKNELEKLKKNIYIPMAFYVPNSIFSNLPEETRRQFDEANLFNTLYILNAEEDLKFLSEDISTINIFEKSTILKSNFIQLIEFENQLTKEAFIHMLNEYLFNARSYNYVYSWMLHHIDKEIPSIQEHNKLFFKHQAEALNQHIIEVNDRFVLYNKHIDTADSLDTIIEKGKELFAQNDHFNKILNDTDLINKKPESTNKKNGRFLLPSEDDVDKILLESIFNINFSEIK